MDYGVFNVGTGRLLTILDVANTLVAHFEDASRHSLSSTRHSPDIVNKFRAGDIRHCFADVSRIRALGYRPQMCFEDGVTELVEWVRSQTAADGFERAREELARRKLAV